MVNFYTILDKDSTYINSFNNNIENNIIIINVVNFDLLINI